MQILLTSAWLRRLSGWLAAVPAFRERFGWSFMVYVTDGSVAFATSVMLARLLGPAQVGAMAAALAGISLFYSIFEGGLGTHLTRLVAQDPAAFRTRLEEAMGMRLVVTLPLLLLLAAPLGWLRIIPGADPCLWGAAVSYLFAMVVYGTWSSAYSGCQAFSAWWAAATPIRLLAMLGTLAAAAWWESIAPAYLANALLVLAALTLLYRRHGCRRPDLDLGRLGGMLKAGLPFLLWNLTSGLTLRFDTFWLGATRSARETGLYSAAYQLFLYLGSLCVPLSTLAYPVLVRRYAENRRRFQETVWTFVGAMLGVSLLATVILRQGAAALVGVLYGPAFQEAVRLAALLSFALLPLHVNRLFSAVLISCDAAWLVALGSFATCALNVLLNMVFIPAYGAAAAVCITFMSELFCAVFFFIIYFIKIKH